MAGLCQDPLRKWMPLAVGDVQAHWGLAPGCLWLVQVQYRQPLDSECQLDCHGHRHEHPYVDVEVTKVEPEVTAQVDSEVEPSESATLLPVRSGGDSECRCTDTVSCCGAPFKLAMTMKPLRLSLSGLLPFSLCPRMVTLHCDLNSGCVRIPYATGSG